MNKKGSKLLPTGILALCGLIVISGIVNKTSFSVDADSNNNYTIKLKSSSNKIHEESDAKDGTYIAKTDLGGEVEFTYEKVKNSAGWQTLAADGFFYNNDAIHGLTKISISLNVSETSYEVHYSDNENFTNAGVQTFETSMTYFFGDLYPNYVKIVNTSGEDLDINSITMTYDCINYWSSLDVTTNSGDESRGIISGSSGAIKIGSECEVKAVASPGYLFRGWYSDSILMCKDENYKFVMPDYDINLTAIFETPAEAHGINPVLDETNNVVKYGMYPQKVIPSSSTVTIETLNKLTETEDNGFYLLEGEYYQKATAYPPSAPCFDNGEAIGSGTTYWFLCCPISWNILSVTGSEYYLLSTNVLDTRPFHQNTKTRTIDGVEILSNNYEYSDIRAWLNGYNGSTYLPNGNDYSGEGFLKSAFSLNNFYLKDVGNGFSGDLVTLLSYGEYLNADYGFSSVAKDFSPTRCCKTSEYSRAKGTIVQLNEEYLNNGVYWTRTNADNLWFVHWVQYWGNIEGRLWDVAETNLGVRPAIKIDYPIN